MASLTNGMTGTVVAIVDPERGTILKAYGTADTAGTPMTPDLHYRIGSVTKTFTADAILRLVDQGKVALTDPISKYVDDLPYGDQITIQDLLAMRSGMYDFGNDTDFFNRYIADPTLPWTVDDSLAIVRAHASEATPPNQSDGVRQHQLRRARAGHREGHRPDGRGAPQRPDPRARPDRPRRTRRTTTCPSRT